MGKVYAVCFLETSESLRREGIMLHPSEEENSRSILGPY